MSHNDETPLVTEDEIHGHASAPDLQQGSVSPDVIISEQELDGIETFGSQFHITEPGYSRLHDSIHFEIVCQPPAIFPVGVVFQPPIVVRSRDRLLLEDCKDNEKNVQARAIFLSRDGMDERGNTMWAHHMGHCLDGDMAIPAFVARALEPDDVGVLPLSHLGSEW